MDATESKNGDTAKDLSPPFRHDDNQPTKTATSIPAAVNYEQRYGRPWLVDPTATAVASSNSPPWWQQPNLWILLVASLAWYWYQQHQQQASRKQQQEQKLNPEELAERRRRAAEAAAARTQFTPQQPKPKAAVASTATRRRLPTPTTSAPVAAGALQKEKQQRFEEESSAPRTVTTNTAKSPPPLSPPAITIATTTRTQEEEKEPLLLPPQQKQPPTTTTMDRSSSVHQEEKEDPTSSSSNDNNKTTIPPATTLKKKKKEGPGSNTKNGSSAAPPSLVTSAFLQHVVQRPIDVTTSSQVVDDDQTGGTTTTWTFTTTTTTTGRQPQQQKYTWTVVVVVPQHDQSSNAATAATTEEQKEESFLSNKSSNSGQDDPAVSPHHKTAWTTWGPLQLHNMVVPPLDNNNTATRALLLRRVATWVDRAHDVQRHGLPILAAASTFAPQFVQQVVHPFCQTLFDRVVWQHALSHVTLELLQAATTKADEEAGGASGNHHEEEEEEENLFSDMVAEAAEENAAKQEDSPHPLTPLLTLLQDPSPPGRFFWDWLQQTFCQRYPGLDLATVLVPPLLSSESTRDCGGALLPALTLLPAVVPALTQRLKVEHDRWESSTTGRDAEGSTWWRGILHRAAYVVPPLDDATPFPFRDELQALANYPQCVFDKGGRDTDQTLQASRQQLREARALLRSLWAKALAHDKPTVVQWMAAVVRVNEPLTTMLKADLLSNEGIAVLASSGSFLAGLLVGLLELCGTNLDKKFQKEGVAAFAVPYLHSKRKDWPAFGPEQASLYTNTDSNSAENEEGGEKTFSGATELFFLTCALLRVALYPMLRNQREHESRQSQLLNALIDLINANRPVPPQIEALGKPVVAAWLGWRTFLTEPDFAVAVTNFTLLQLKWLVVVGQQQEDAMALLPDWMCKQPAIWLAHMARTASHLLKPYQGGLAVECAADLLAIGTRGLEKGTSLFSPVVLTEVIRIVSAFVGAGVARAKQTQRRRERRARSANPNNREPEEDDRYIDIYLGFDQNDLGVTVFTNEKVVQRLCPVLLQTFCSLDIIEGLDVDREHAFDKLSVKGEIADLLLRLWAHPSGNFRQSIVQARAQDLCRFTSSVAGAIGYLLDDACLRLKDICNLRRRQQTRRGLGMNDRQFLASQSQVLGGFFCSARCLLFLLCRFSQESSFAAVVGGKSGTKESLSCAASLATLVVHFLDLLTDADGNTHPDLDMRVHVEPSTKLVERLNLLSLEDRQMKASDLVSARTKLRKEFGFDAAVLCYQMLALSASWHQAAASKDKSSPFLQTLCSKDDCSLSRYTAIFERLVKGRSTIAVVSGSEGENAALLFSHDGYVDVSIWDGKYKTEESNNLSLDNWHRLANKNQIRIEELRVLASDDVISSFLSDLALEIEKSPSSGMAVALEKSDRESLQAKIMSGDGRLSDDGYGATLEEWVISSSPFANSTSEFFLHYYDATARNRNMTSSGKILVKEARRCLKAIPRPHPNAACFVCFGEERMDLCRGVVTGPVETPYAHGLFAFDVFYPSTYPLIPPLVTFMTTGGGQTRMHPNLYQEGKVCLSLLGTFHAGNESERWNPDRSSLAQVLLSIQTQLLVPEPYFHEPGYDRTRGTEAGNDGSRRYNAGLRLATLRHGIIGALKEPPRGFEEVSLRHFSMCRKRILFQARRWMMEAKGSAIFQRFERAFNELVLLLAKEMLQKYEALPPLAEDIRVLQTLEPSFLTGSGVANEGEEDTKPAAQNTPVDSSTTIAGTSLNVPFNPWAEGASMPPTSASPPRQNDDDDPDDEMYL